LNEHNNKQALYKFVIIIIIIIIIITNHEKYEDNDTIAYDNKTTVTKTGFSCLDNSSPGTETE